MARRTQPWGNRDYWLVVRSEKKNQFSGSASTSLPALEQATLQDLCISAIYLAKKFAANKTDLVMIKHTLQYKVGMCRHRWLTCDDAKVLFCMHCNVHKSEIDKKQQHNQAEGA